jgi:hypothetical protein
MMKIDARVQVEGVHRGLQLQGLVTNRQKG